ncbi:MAG: hypothetical protein V3U18_07020 [Alphaproteobacteria bacterium]
MTFATQHDIGAEVKSVKGINPADSAAATINGPAIDRSGFLSAVLHHASGAATGTPTAQTVDSKLQDSADGSTGWADITGAAAAQLTADDTDADVNVDFGTTKKFIRVVTTVGFTGGTSPTIPVAATVMLGGPDVLPA